MQNITFYVNAKETLGVCRDYANAKTVAAPTLVLGVGATLRMRLFAGADTTERYPLEMLDDIVAWQWNMDADFNGETAYKVVSPPGSILVLGTVETVDAIERSYTEVFIPLPEMHTAELTEWLGDAESKSGLHGELVGCDASGKTVFILQIRNFTIRNRITSLGNPTEIDPEFLTAEQVRALISSGVVMQFSVDGVSWHDGQNDGDVYLRFRSASDASARWSEAVKMPVAQIVGGSGGGSGIVIDATFSASSTNPVQNRVITAELAKKITAPAGAAPGQVLTTDGVGFYWSTPSSGGASVTVDSSLSLSSTNPVQNAVITAKVNELADAVNTLNTSISGAEQSLVNLGLIAEGI